MTHALINDTDRQFAEALGQSLIWLPEQGYGYLSPEAGNVPYDEGYFAEYQRRAQTDVGRALTGRRVALVDQYTDGYVLDVGIGAGQFVEARNAAGHLTKGFDVNPVGIAWLKERNWWANPKYVGGICAVTLWDVLEHLPRPEDLLDKVIEYVFTSLPIFDGPEHVLRSKHYKPGEHLWYFSRDGLAKWMRGYDFELVEENRMEEDLGREGILTAVFKRIEV